MARGLIAWGVKSITLVDSGVVAYSNPVRQSLYEHSDCVGGSEQLSLTRAYSPPSCMQVGPARSLGRKA